MLRSHRHRSHHDSRSRARRSSFLRPRGERLEQRLALTAVANGEEVVSSILASESSTFEFEASSGDLIHIQLSSHDSGNANAHLQVSFDGMVQRSDTESPGNAEAVFIASNTGTYVATVSDSGNDDAMNFRFRVVVLPAAPALIPDRDGQLIDGEEVISNVPQRGFNVFRFHANHGDTVALQVTEPTGVDDGVVPRFHAYDPNGRDPEGRPGTVIRSTPLTFVAETTGSYTIIVSYDQPADETDVLVRSVVLPGDIGFVTDRDAWLDNGEQVTVDLPTRAIAVYQFNVEQGENYLLAVSDSSDELIRLQVEIYEEDGDRRAAVTEFEAVYLPAFGYTSGTHTAIVYGDLSDPARLTIRKVSVESDPILLPGQDAYLESGESFDTTVERGGVNIVRFQANAGDYIRYSVSGETLPHIKFFQLSGSWGGSSADARGGAFPAPRDGIYSIGLTNPNRAEPLPVSVRVVTLPSTPELISGRDAFLQSGQEVESYLPAGSFNVFPFQAAADEWIKLAVFGADVVSQDIYYWVLDANGNTIDINDGLYFNRDGGTYTLVVESRSPSAANIQVRVAALSQTPLLVPGRDALLASGDEIMSHIPRGGFNVFLYEATAGESVQVAIAEDANTRPKFYVYSPAGEQLTPYQFLDYRFTAQSSGAHVILVTEDGDNAPLDFSIRVAGMSQVETLIPGRDAILASGEEVLLDIPAGSFNLIQFDANAGDVVRYESWETATVFDPLGAEVDAVGSDSGWRFTASQTGRFTALVHAADFAEAQSLFRVITLPSDPILIVNRDATLGSGEEITLDSTWGQVNLIRFNVTQPGQAVLLLAAEESVVRPWSLEAFDPLGEILESAASGQYRFATETPGDHTIFVSTFGTDFTARLILIPDSPELIEGRDLLLNNGQEGIAETPNRRHSVIQFNVDAPGTTYLIVDDSRYQVSTSTAVYSPRGELIHSDSNFDSTLLDTPETGIYTAVVTNTDRSGDVDHAVRVVSFAGEPMLFENRDANLINQVPVEPTVPERGVNLYRFQARAGDDLLVESIKLPGGANVIDLQLYDPAGSRVLRSSVTGGRQWLEFDAPLTGEYTVVVINSRFLPTRHRLVVTGIADGLSRHLMALDNSGELVPLGRKRPLFAGYSADRPNLSGLIQGIHAVAIDGLTGNLGNVGTDDIQARSGRTNDTSNWQPVAVAPTITFIPAAGLNGADRILLTWPNGTISNTWLEVTVKANPNTGLSEDDTSYFGSQVGDVNGNGQTNAIDFSFVRLNQRNFLNPATVDNLYDLNRDGRVNAHDLAIVRDNATGIDDNLPLITPIRTESQKSGVQHGKALVERASQQVHAKGESASASAAFPSNPPIDSTATAVDKFLAEYAEAASAEIDPLKVDGVYADLFTEISRLLAE